VNTADVDRYLSAIEDAAEEGDYEKAGGLEDQLYVGVLEAIADESTEEPQRLAELALQSRNTKFPRWGA
jgi:hypothetical protein